MTDRPLTSRPATPAAPTVALDVREDIRNGREPFSKIMQAVARLAPDEELLLLAPFEPAPLYRILEQRGFGHSSRPLGGGDWEVRFIRQESSAGSAVQAPRSVAAAAPAAADSSSEPSEIVEVDARGLEPPQPLVTILEAVATLPNTALLKARTDRRPIHLYAQLEARGFTAETQEQPDGSFLTHVRRQ